MDLQSFSHDCFSKISRTLFDFLNKTYWVSLFLRNNLLIFRTGVSCFFVTLFYSTLFCCGGKANLVRFTLFYSTLLTLTHRQNDRQRNESSRLSGECAIIITTGKKSSSCLSGGCAITTISTTGPIYAKSFNFYVKLNVSNLNVRICISFS
jgi:hypothetical protein